MDELIHFIFRGPAEPLEADSVGAWWAESAERRAEWEAPVAWAWALGQAADRVGHAFAAGYQAALRMLVPALPASAIVSFCATEEQGNRPRHIETRLEPQPDAGWALDGSKRWSTLALDAQRLLVVASAGTDDAGRKRLKLVLVDRDAAGVSIEAMPAPPFMPEVRHGKTELRGVLVTDDAVLPGDGYSRYVKPFRSLEDLCVHAALLGYQCSVARRHGWPAELVERLAVLAAATMTVARLDPAAAETHLALAGLLEGSRSFASETRALWVRVEQGERERWERDRRLVEVAGRARDMRRRRAWESLGRPLPDGESPDGHAAPPGSQRTT